MKDIDLQIGGRHYRLACAPGEEEHLARLGAMIDRKLAEEPGLASLSETRMLLYAALLLADQIDELQKRRSAPAAAPVPSAQLDMLETLAGRLETIAGELEESDRNA